MSALDKVINKPDGYTSLEWAIVHAKDSGVMLRWCEEAAEELERLRGENANYETLLSVNKDLAAINAELQISTIALRSRAETAEAEVERLTRYLELAKESIAELSKE